MCYLYFFCLHCCLINIHIFDYPDSRLSGLFTEVPTSPDNRGSTVLDTSKYGEDQASTRSPKKTQGSRGKGSKQLKLCYRRTGSDHSQKRPFIKARCYHCGITGHTQQACREKKATQQTNDSGVNVMKRADSEESDGEYGDLYHISNSKNRRPISLEVYLEGWPLVMELDTGLAVTHEKDSVSGVLAPCSPKGNSFEATYLRG